MKFLWRAVKWLLLIAVLILLAVWGYKKLFPPEEQMVYSTSLVTRGDMCRSISATGTVEPEELVNVGAQVGGMITTLGVDADGKTVDYCSNVTAGTILANIDDALYAASLRGCEAAKAQAEASIKSAQATIELNEAKLVLAKANWERAQKLNPQSVIAKSDYDSAKADYATALAEIDSSRAALAQAQAQLASADAELERARWNLQYCVIKSPVDGVIIDRRVNVGQTVNSSMSAPSLFLIAKDLKRMDVWVSVNEADVGNVMVGQEAEFTVDAFGGRVFKGMVQKIRLNATMSQNVVTYVAEIVTDNSDGTLLPYLTANVNFILARRENVLTVPNSALRYTPPANLVPPEYHGFELKDDEKLVWTLDDGRLKPMAVTVGLNDGVNTEILSGISEGMEVVTGASVVKTAELEKAEEASSGSPFLPKMPHRGGKK